MSDDVISRLRSYGDEFEDECRLPPPGTMAEDMREAVDALSQALTCEAVMREALGSLEGAIMDGLCNSGTPADDGGISHRLDAALEAARAALSAPSGPDPKVEVWDAAIEAAAAAARNLSAPASYDVYELGRSDGIKDAGTAIRGLKRGGG